MQRLDPKRPLIEADALAAALSDPRLRVFDCRFRLGDPGWGGAVYAQAHIPGARYAHLDRDLSGPITPRSGRHPLPSVERFCAWLGTNGVDVETPVVAYDDAGGTMAARLWWLLRWLGHGEVWVLDGGWQAWIDAGLAVTTAEAPVQPCAYHAAAEAGMLASTAEVAAGGNWLLLDVRSAERYRGEQEPIDPVAGHIPGAWNLPLERNLARNGRFLSASELRRLYLDALAGRDPSRVICYCGSGVTACQSLLAMAQAGLAGARLYAGSWSEWIRDPARPVATGDHDAGP